MKPLSSSSPLLVFIFLFLFSSMLEGATSPRKNNHQINGPLLTSKLATEDTIIVDPSGNGDFMEIQPAIDSVPDGNSHWIIIHIRAGEYRERVLIPESKEYIFLRGNGKGRTAIVWNDGSSNNTVSATFKVNAANCVAFGISFKNDAPIGHAGSPFNRSVAAMVSGDKVAFYHCGFYSPHNTLFDHKGRHYYESCYIQGNIDFIFGRARSIFQSCEIFVRADSRMKIHGSITAQNRESEEDDSGFMFLEGRVYGTNQAYLGRANGPYSRVIFTKTYLSKTITPEGWTDWGYEGTTDHMLHGEHECFGPGANPRRRAPWARQLTKKEAAPFMSIEFIDGKEWLPAYQ